MSPAAANALQRTYDNYCRIWLMLTEMLVAGATQQRIDALTAAAEGSGIPMPKVTYSLDGESYDWTGYQAQLGEIMANVRRQLVFAQGPFEVRSRAY